MTKWLLPTAGIVAVVVAAIGTFAIAGGFDDDDGGDRQWQVVGDGAEDGDTADEARCAADATDCIDPNDVDDGPLGQCAPGVTDCVDTAVDGGAAGICLEGTVDCVDTPGIADCQDATVECNDTGGGECGPDNTAACEARVTEMVFADLEQHVPGQEITITSVEYVDWPDSSLGNPQPDMSYAQVITPGFKIVLEAGGQAYEYHADLKGSISLVE